MNSYLDTESFVDYCFNSRIDNHLYKLMCKTIKVYNSIYFRILPVFKTINTVLRLPIPKAPQLPAVVTFGVVTSYI